MNNHDRKNEMHWKNQIKEYLNGCRACNLVTRISPWKRGEHVTLTRSVIGRDAPDFAMQPLLVMAAGTGRRDGNPKEDPAENEAIFYEPVVGKDRLIILGGGHISKCLCEFAAKTGFTPWVVDERPEFATKKRFPLAERVICGDFTRVLKGLHITENDYVAILTRGHSCDGDCLHYILTHDMPGYLGMIGSKRRVAAQFAMLKKMGIPEEKIALVHNPIGLPIRAVTPEEIAVSILAELIGEKRKEPDGKKIRTELDIDVCRQWIREKRPCASAVILTAEGSSPRKAGARMLIYEDKSIVGTIGGGLLENRVIEKGHAMIGTGEAFLFHFVMDADVAAREGMACGGRVDVLIEDVF